MWSVPKLITEICVFLFFLGTQTSIFHNPVAPRGYKTEFQPMEYE